MKTNWTTEQKKEICKLLDEYREYVWKKGVTMLDLETFKKKKGLLPTLEAGWYKCNANRNWMAYFDGKKYIYGIDGYGVWFDCLTGTPHGTNLGNVDVLATEDEVREALIKEAKRRGYKEGFTVKCLRENYNRKLDEYDIRVPMWEVDLKGMFNLGNKGVMRDGKWAEIIEEVPEYTWEQLKEKLGHEFKIKDA